MGGATVLQMIWRGDIEAAEGPAAQRLQQFLAMLFPVHSLWLSAAHEHPARVCEAETELMPGLPLGDVLTEELGLDVPYGAMVVVDGAGALDTAADDHEISHRLGAVTAEVLLGAIRRGVFPLRRETDALYVMACACARIVAAPDRTRIGLRPGAFREGLAVGLASYWSGSGATGSMSRGLAVGADFLTCPKLRSYLKSLDAGFSAPAPAQVEEATMPAGALRGYEGWLRALRRSVMAELDRLESREFTN